MTLPKKSDEILTNLMQSQAALVAPSNLKNRYETYLHCADDGSGGDITRGGAPLRTFEEWLSH
tara:strand:- start:649 stop:837 length:189 start_codon:yes stop_codon:yes gene_type:complete